MPRDEMKAVTWSGMHRGVLGIGKRRKTMQRRMIQKRDEARERS